MDLKVTIEERVLHFKQPAGTSRGVYTERKSWMVGVSDGETVGRSEETVGRSEGTVGRCEGTVGRNGRGVGWGECGPLPDLSCDARPDYGEVLRRVGASEQALRALSLSRRIVAAVGLFMLVWFFMFGLTLFNLVEPAKNAVRLGAAAAFGFYVVCRIQIVRFARAVTGLIAALSE